MSTGNSQISETTTTTTVSPATVSKPVWQPPTTTTVRPAVTWRPRPTTTVSCKL